MEGNENSINIDMLCLGTDENSSNLKDDESENSNLSYLEFNGLCATVNNRKEKKRILKSVKGRVNQKEILGILGSSGCGKTTLLEVVAGKSEMRTGKKWTLGGFLCLDGEKLPVGTSQPSIGFVEQHNSLLSSLTVEETLSFYSDLSLPSSLTKEIKHEKLEKLIHDFNLEKIRNSRIKVLSGGEKKRLSIACQVVRDLKILLLDEPTSGLSSCDSFELVDYLKNFAVQNDKGIIMSLHQPSREIFELLDNILLLKEGYTIYSGPRRMVLDFFKSHGHVCPPDFSPPDFLLDLIFETPLEVLLSYRSGLSEFTSINQDYEASQIEIEPSIKTKRRRESYSNNSFLHQTFVLLKRNSLYLFRHRGTIIGYFVSSALLSLIWGWIYFNLRNKSNPSLQDYISLAFLIANPWGIVVTSLETFSELSGVFFKEYEERLYGNFSYIITSTIFMLLRTFSGIFVLTVPVYFMAALPGDTYFDVYLFTVLFALALDCSVNFVAHVQSLPNNLAFQLTTIFIFVNFYVSGFYVQNMPSYISWLKILAISHYSFEGVLTSFLKDYTSNSINGNQVIQQNNYKPLSYYYESLFIFFIFWYIMWVLVIFIKPHQRFGGLFQMIYFGGNSTKIASSISPHYEKLNLENKNPLAANISWNNLSVRLKEKKNICFKYKSTPKTILSNSFGFIQPGKMLAILGASGSGKTTLLKTIFQKLNQKQYELSGEIRINGLSLEKDFNLSHFTGFVSQNPEFHSSLTISQTLKFITDIALINCCSEEKNQKQLNIMKALGLEHIKNSKIKHISGGELKRLNIASELILGRGILALDEPTTGLSAKESLYISEILRSLADQGVAIVASIHQPPSDVLQFFDYVLILNNGETIFFGKREDLIPFFTRYQREDQNINLDKINQAEFALNAVNKLEKEKVNLSSSYRDSDQAKKMLELTKELETGESLQERKTNFSFFEEIKKFWILYYRMAIVSMYNHDQRNRFFLPIIYFVFFILITAQMPLDVDHVRDRIGALVMPLTTLLLWSNFVIIGGIESFQVFKLEYNKGLYSLETFFFSSQLGYMTHDCLIIFIGTVILYWTIGLYASTANFFIYLYLFMLNYLIWIEVNLIFVPIAKSFAAGLSMIAVFEYFFIWLSGFWISKADMTNSLSQFYYINCVGAVLEGLVKNEFDTISFYDLQTNQSIPGSYFLDQLEFTDSVWSRVLMVGVIFSALIILRFVVLKLSNKSI